MKIIFESEEEFNNFDEYGCPPQFQYEIKKESTKMTDKTPKEITYTDCVYELIKEECKDLDSIYEDYIISLVGNCGLAALKRANLIESCGVINCRRLYVLCDYKVN